MRIFDYLYFLLFIVFVSSCSSQQSHLLFKSAASPAVAGDSSLTAARAAKSSYQIQPRDILQVRNLQNIKYIVDELPGNAIGGGAASQGQTYEVDEDGTVALPALGHVPVSGLTRVEVTKKIEDLYRKSLLKDPILEVKIVNLKVTIFGEASSQGNFPLLKDNTTLVEMIGQAGGLSSNADEKNVKIIRGAGDQKIVTQFDLSSLQVLSDPRAVLQNGDIIYISKNKRAVRADNVQNLGTILQPVTLLLSTVLILFTLKRL